MVAKTHQQIRLGLLGNTGVGKDTCVKLIKKNYPFLIIKCLKLATPLYDVQKYIYKRCRKKIGSCAQDGVLLNFLGTHMRKINPAALEEPFAKAVELHQDKVDLLICSDVRPTDVPSVKALGFNILHIACDTNTALERRLKRGDISLGNPAHTTETGVIPLLYDYQIINNDSVFIFERNIIRVVDTLIKPGLWNHLAG